MDSLKFVADNNKVGLSPLMYTDKSTHPVVNSRRLAFAVFSIRFVSVWNGICSEVKPDLCTGVQDYSPTSRCLMYHFEIGENSYGYQVSQPSNDPSPSYSPRVTHLPQHYYAVIYMKSNRFFVHSINVLIALTD